MAIGNYATAKPSGKVILNILNTLQPYRHPQQVLTNPGSIAFGLRDPRMGGGGGMGDGGFGVAQVRGYRDHFDCIYHPPRFGSTALDFE